MTKKTMKAVFMLALMVITFSACDAISGLELTNQESIDKKMPSKFEKHIDPQSTVFEISFGTTADFSTEMDVVTIEFIPAGETERKRLTFSIPGNQEPREQKIVSMPKIPAFGKNKPAEEPTGIKLQDVDFSKIASNVAKATTMMTEMDRKVDGISYYDMKVDENPENVIHNFTMTSKEDTNFGSEHGRAAIITEYYEFKFTADADGNVTYKE